MNLFYEGGPLFMGLVTIVFFSGIAVAIMAVISILKGADTSKVKATLEYVKSIGAFCLDSRGSWADDWNVQCI